jgi:hypothetical protein
MARYKTYDYRQRVLLPVSLEEQLMPGTLEFAIHTLVEKRCGLPGGIGEPAGIIPCFIRGACFLPQRAGGPGKHLAKEHRPLKWPVWQNLYYNLPLCEGRVASECLVANQE